jgi:hypothetical protein
MVTGLMTEHSALNANQNHWGNCDRPRPIDACLPCFRDRKGKILVQIVDVLASESNWRAENSDSETAGKIRSLPLNIQDVSVDQPSLRRKASRRRR